MEVCSCVVVKCISWQMEQTELSFRGPDKLDSLLLSRASVFLTHFINPFRPIHCDTNHVNWFQPMKMHFLKVFLSLTPYMSLSRCHYLIKASSDRFPFFFSFFGSYSDDNDMFLFNSNLRWYQFNSKVIVTIFYFTFSKWFNSVDLEIREIFSAKGTNCV